MTASKAAASAIGWTMVVGLVALLALLAAGLRLPEWVATWGVLIWTWAGVGAMWLVSRRQ